MYVKIERCPNVECPHSKAPPERRWFIKKGYFRTAHDRQQVPRYRCKGCGRYFSTHSFREDKGHKKPALNKTVFDFYASGMTQRRLAIVLGCNRKTVVRKFFYVARLARAEHIRQIKIGALKTASIQFDEMETYEHTKFRPLSIALAVCGGSGRVLAASVAVMKPHGYLARNMPQRYRDEFRPDTRGAALDDILMTAKECTSGIALIESDKKPAYMRSVRKWFPGSTYVRHHSRAQRVKRGVRSKFKKPMFFLNHTCAKIRGDLSRMARRTWCTTKKEWALQAHLDLYIAWNNGYQLPV